MKILLIHNKYGRHSGEEAVVYAQEELLRSHGHEVATYFRSSEEIHGPAGNVNAFFSGFYNKTSVQEIKRRTRDEGRGTTGPPDIVHIHNLYPLISPAILHVIKAKGRRVDESTSRQNPSPHHHITTSPPKIIMTVHNYRLICPNGLFFTHGSVCERCAGGKEWNCILYNCEDSVFKSTGYAARNWWARNRRSYLDHVDAFLCLTEFQKGKLTENGFPAAKCFVLPNFMDTGAESVDRGDGSFVFFAGRINRQKGFDLLAQAAAGLPDIPFRIAGNEDRRFVEGLSLTENIVLAGNLSPTEMEEVFQYARFLVFTSRSYEGFPMVFLEAMKHRIPVIAPNLAGYPEIIRDRHNGLLYTPGDAADLAAKIRMLWDDKELCARLGANGFNKLKSDYSSSGYYHNLIRLYERQPD
jgi:glycosyltransferase involved in cell wall biosynthesis